MRHAKNTAMVVRRPDFHGFSRAHLAPADKGRDFDRFTAEYFEFSLKTAALLGIGSIIEHGLVFRQGDLRNGDRRMHVVHGILSGMKQVRHREQVSGVAYPQITRRF